MLLLRPCRAASTFLSRILSWSKLAPEPRIEFVRGRCAAELLLELGVILVWLLALDSGRVRRELWLLPKLCPNSSMLLIPLPRFTRCSYAARWTVDVRRRRDLACFRRV